MSTQLVQNIDWIGYVDWNIRDFHSFDTNRGATYNSYLIRDEKTAVIDAVKAPFVENLLGNIAEKTPLDSVDYVVCNHAEPDHAGGLPELLKNLPNAILLCNAKCKEALAGYFDISQWKIQIVLPNESVSLGNKTLQFLNTPMVHWPESMFTYIPEDRILFSMDAFGQHLATSARFDDEYDLSTILQEAKCYYANIVTPYSKQVLKTLETAQTIPLAIDMIAPSHGLIWRSHIPAIFDAYNDWASGKYAPRVLILFDSMWNSTAQIAEAILNGATKTPHNVDVELMHVRHTSLTRIATEMLDSAAVAIGTPTLNMTMMPQIGALTTYLQGLKFSSKDVCTFGSFGWSPAGLQQLDAWTENMKWTRLCDPIKSQFKPKTETLEQAKQAGKLLAESAWKKSQL
ncbi:MAG: FprA family A-type flavoprotein [Thermoguttaceae bacterium]